MGGARELIVAILAAALAAYVSHGAAFRWAVDDVGARGARLLDLAGASFEEDLERFAALPGALVEFREIAEIDREADLAELNLLLERVAQESGARELFVLDYLGVAVAASGWRADQNVLGAWFGFRPYYFEALLHGRGAYHAVSAASGDRGFYFSRVFTSRADGRRYILVVRLDAARVEAAWSGAPLIALFDDAGVGFLSSTASLRFSALEPLDAEALRAFARSRQFERARLRLLDVVSDRSIGPWRILRFGSAPLDIDEALLVERPIADGRGFDGFVLRAFLDLGGARRRAAQIAALSGLSAFLLAAGAAGVARRRRRALEEHRREAEAKLELERRVIERTAALSETNARLEREAAERRAADAALERAETDLAQARKLAALGRLSADVSHELNQPLAAIRAYAENAETFLERADHQAAAGNLSRIAELAERIARIIANLRTFARGESPTLRPVKVGDALNDAYQLLESRFERIGARLERDDPGLETVVMFGRARLQQVFTNLLSNALDALGDADVRRITVSARRRDDRLDIEVRDTGPGLPAELLDAAFDPFVTTKGVGDGPGLGLGLSIVYGMATSSGGGVAVRNARQGGAVFTLTLRAAVEKEPA